MVRRKREALRQEVASKAASAEQSEFPKFNRVWFIGAGFTVAVGYPLGRDLVADLIAYLQGDMGRLLTAAPQSVRERFSITLSNRRYADATERILKNIECFSRQYLARSLAELKTADVAEFFSVAHALAEQEVLSSTRPTSLQAGSQAGAVPLRQLYHDLAAVTRTFFVDTCNAVGDWPPDFKSVLKGIQPSDDAIVNFNWDEEVDFFLTMNRDDDDHTYDVAYTAHSWEEDRFLVLKPHGSIGWYDLAQGIGNEDMYFIADHKDRRIDRFDKRLVSYGEFDLPKDIGRRGVFAVECPPVITPPTFAKRFPYREQALIWRDIIEVCGRADEFIFLGYSVPPDDYLTRAAIRSAIAGRSGDARRKDLKPLNCLVVTKLDEDDQPATNGVIDQFQKVFGDDFGKANLLPWTIGDRAYAKSLFREIRKRLPVATIGQAPASTP
ncbi:MAG: hypothetical protein GXY83_00895 [Rhodopirellula sp.]|nr:hypothetical protein [Rhodopirellula sp.]